MEQQITLLYIQPGKPTLQYVINDLDCNVVLYSIYCLPEDAGFRKTLIDSVLDNGLVMHFVNEDTVIANRYDADEVAKLLAFAKYDEQ